MIELSVREPRSRLLDEPFVLRARGEDADTLTWRARYRDDESRVWKAEAASPEELALAWGPAKPDTAPPHAALASLRPVRIDVRVEAPDGRAASRQLTRHVLAAGVRPRRWRESGLQATLYLPAEPAPGAPTLALDATAEPDAAPVVAALLASRGVLTLAVLRGRLDVACERLAAVPGASGAVSRAVLRPAGDAVPLPPGVAVRDDDPQIAAARAAAWDALLERAGARPREAP